MKKIRQLKVALVGLMTTPFAGPKEENYKNDGIELEKLAQELQFELKIFRKGIYSLEAAEAAAAECADWGADFILLQASSFSGGAFIYPFSELKARLGLWSVPEGAPTREGGLPLNSFTALNMYNSILKLKLKDYHQPVKWFFGRVNDALFQERFALTVRALTALVNLSQAKIGLVGGVAPGFDNLEVDYAKLRNRFGTEVIEFSFEEVLAQAREIQDEALIQKTSQMIRKPSNSFDNQMLPALEKTARLQIAYQNLVDENDLNAVAVSCWPDFQDAYQLGVCTMMGSLNETGIVAACEGDIPSAMGMLTLHYLTMGDVVTLMDLVTVDPNDDSILFWHCGPTAPSLADANGVDIQSLWLFDGQPTAPMGLHNNLTLHEGAATMFGFMPDFDQMLVLEGTFDPAKPSYVGSRGWFKQIQLANQNITVPVLVETLVKSGFQHHYPIAYGRLMQMSYELANWSGIKMIEPVEYHPYLQ